VSDRHIVESGLERICLTFPIRNGLKQGDGLSPLLFNFALGMSLGWFR
jgi:hypothetical protein